MLQALVVDYYHSTLTLPMEHISGPQNGFLDNVPIFPNIHPYQHRLGISIVINQQLPSWIFH